MLNHYSTSFKGSIMYTYCEGEIHLFCGYIKLLAEFSFDQPMHVPVDINFMIAK
jgi:hypothetical protein